MENALGEVLARVLVSKIATMIGEASLALMPAVSVPVGARDWSHARLIVTKFPRGMLIPTTAVNALVEILDEMPVSKIAMMIGAERP